MPKTIELIANVKTADWILICAIAILLLSITEGVVLSSIGLNISVAHEDQEDGYMIGGLLIFVWVSMRYFPAHRPENARTRAEDKEDGRTD